MAPQGSLDGPLLQAQSGPMLRWFRFFSHWPLWALHLLGWGLGWGVWLFSAAYRRRLIDNARQAGLGRLQIALAIGHAGCMVAELPRVWLGRLPRLRWRARQRVQAAMASGQGVIFLTPHLGCFEMTAQAVAHDFSAQYGPLTVLFRPARRPDMDALMRASRQRPGLRTAPTTLSGVRQMLKALRAGEAVGLLPDQVPPLGMGVWVPFFGRQAYTMTLAARLARQTGARIVLVWGERLSWGRGFLIHTQDLPQPLPEDLTAAVLQINQAMEQIILQCPQQYLWGYHRYRQAREETL